MRLFLSAHVLGWRILRYLLLALRRRMDIFWLDDDEPPRPPLELPIRIAAVVLSEFDVGAGFQLDPLEQPEHVREGSYDIVVVRGRDLASLLKPGLRARLVICGGMQLRSILAARYLPVGTALLYVPSQSLYRFIPALLAELAKDLPLKQSARAAARAALQRSSGSLLLLGRRANHAFRLGDIAELLRMQCELAAIPFHSGKDHQWLKDLAATHEKLRQSSVSDSMEQRRRCDVVLMHGAYRKARPRVVEPGVTLQADCDYLVQLHIGKQLRASLMEQDTEADGYGADHGKDANRDLLEAVLQPKDFIPRGPDRLELPLPHAGSSRFIYFAVRAPAQPCDKAVLRVILYRRNRMVESLLLESQITEREYPLRSRERGVSAKVEFSQAESFTGLSELIPRVLTFSVNRSEATHTVMVKGTNVHAPVSLGEEKVKTWTDAYRELLQMATVSEKGEIRQEWSTSESREYLAKGAHLGSRIYRGSLDRARRASPRLDAVLQYVRQGQGETISVVRHDAGFTFPWAVFYDWPLPSELWRYAPFVGAPEFCLGMNGEVPCGHTHESEVYCVRGFWGYRFRIEEMIGNTGRPRIETLPCTDPPLKFLACTKSPRNTQIIIDEFKKKGTEVTAADLPKRFWDSNWRAPLMALFAHQDSDPYLGLRLVVERDAHDWSAKTWLSCEELAQLAAKPWSLPSSIVLLLACESAATSPQTLTDFVLAFHEAGAAAIVGTEAQADAELLLKAGKELMGSLLQAHQPLGEAMRRLRVLLLQQGNPLAFVFASIGNADLRIEPCI